MRDRLITLLGAGIALYILVRLLFPGAGLGEQHKPISYPTTVDHHQYGLAGAYRWLESQHVPVYSLRQRYSTLGNNQSLAHSGNLLVISLPLRMNAHAQEIHALKTWVKNGNNVLLLISMSNWPQWASRRMSQSITKMLGDFGLGITLTRATVLNKNKHDDAVSRVEDAASRIDKLLHPKAKTRQLVPADATPYTRDVHHVQASWQLSEGLNWHLTCHHHSTSNLVLLRDQASHSPALWLGFYGKGRLIISRHSGIFDNASLGLADNARLLSNLVYQLRGTHGHVVFDDMHQGLTTIYDPHAFFRDPRLHHTLLFLFVLWLIYVLGHTNRFGRVRQSLPQLQLREHVEAIGNLFARRLHPSAVALRYARHFFNEVRAAYGLPLNGAPVWSQLKQNTAIDPDILHQAQSMYHKATQHQRVNLVHFFNALKTMRRELR